MVFGRPPDLIGSRVIEARASLIRDPAKRLRFLRNSQHLCRIQPPRRKRLKNLGVALLCGFALVPYPAPNSIAGTAVLPSRAAVRVPDAIPRVWPADTGDGYELYSNGLRIETGFTVSSRAREAYV